MSTTPVLTNLVSFTQGKQDTWRLPAAFISKFLAEIRLRSHGKDDHMARGFEDLWNLFSVIRWGDRALFALQGLEAILNGRHIEKGSTALENNLRLIQSVMMIVHGTTDWVGFFSTHVKDFSPANPGAYGVPSCVSWAVMILCDFVLDLVGIQRLTKQLKKTTDRTQQVLIMRMMKKRYLNIIANACDLPLAVNWAVDGDLSGLKIGFLGSVGALIRVNNKWPVGK